MITPSQAKNIETFARAVTVAESPVEAPTPGLVKELLHDLNQVIKREWAYALFIEIGTNNDNVQGYGATVMTTERSTEALSEAIAKFWLQLRSEGVF